MYVYVYKLCGLNIVSKFNYSKVIIDFHLDIIVQDIDTWQQDKQTNKNGIHEVTSLNTYILLFIFLLHI